MGGDLRTVAEFRAIHAEFLAAFPDLKITVEDTVAEGENVVVRRLATTCHRGEGFGPKATDRDGCFRGTTWLRFQDGAIAEAWDSWNQGDLFPSLQSQLD